MFSLQQFGWITFYMYALKSCLMVPHCLRLGEIKKRMCFVEIHHPRTPGFDAADDVITSSSLPLAHPFQNLF